MIIKKPDISDSLRIAELHINEIPTGFISSLNKQIVSKLYELIIKTEIVFVVEKDKKIIAFITCALDTGKLYKHFIINNLFKVLPYFFVRLFSLVFIRKIFETLLAPFKTKITDDEMPELLSIVVDHEHQSGGIGISLLETLEKELIEKNINRYKVIAGENLVSANKFYLKYGFKLSKKIEIHKGTCSNVYIKIIAMQ